MQQYSTPQIILSKTPPSFAGEDLALDIEVVGQGPMMHISDGEISIISVTDGKVTWVMTKDTGFDFSALWGVLDKCPGYIVVAHGIYDFGYILRDSGKSPIALWGKIGNDGKYRQRLIWDVISFDQMFYNLFREHSLAALSERWLGRRLNKEVRSQFETNSFMNNMFQDSKEGIEYCAQDALTTLNVFRAQISVANKEMIKIYHLTEMGMISILLSARHRGIYINTKSWLEYINLLEGERKQVAEILVNITGIAHITNASILSILKKRYNLDISDTSEKTLKDILSKHDSAELKELITLVLRLRELDKILSTYGTAFINKATVDEYGRKIVPSFSSHGTITGRMSSTQPNLQNIPHSSEMRSFFIAPPGHALIIADYNAQEPRIAAQISKDPIFIEAFRSGDFYINLAKAVWGINITDKHDPKRQIMKIVILAAMYGMGKEALAKKLDISVEESSKTLKALHTSLSKFSAWKAGVKSRAIVFTLIGRPIWCLSPLASRYNYPVQGSGSDMLKIAVNEFYRQWIDRFADTGEEPFSLFVHDEIVLCVPESVSQEAANLLSESMRNAARILMPDVGVKVDVFVGAKWSDKQ